MVVRWCVADAVVVVAAAAASVAVGVIVVAAAAAAVVVVLASLHARVLLMHDRPLRHHDLLAPPPRCVTLRRRL